MLPVLLHGCESWLVDTAAPQRLVVFHNGCVRGVCGINRRQVREGRITAIEMLRRLRLQPIEYYLRRRQFRWLGNIARMPVSRLPRFMFNAVPDTADANPRRTAGRARTTARNGAEAALRWADILTSD